MAYSLFQCGPELAVLAQFSGTHSLLVLGFIGFCTYPAGVAMRSATADCESSTQGYRKKAGDEPLPGYVLLQPLGRGGFGEVWKCEAPGGLHKAVKFVPGACGDDGSPSNQFQQEFDAFLHIKTIRHPFLLTLERVEQLDGDLVMVMELADHQMRDRFEECRREGLPGIPRDELLGYFGEAAEALDVLNTEHHLQHLDVKPANLFITSGHVKVGDYGLVSRLDRQTSADKTGGLTPKYVAPEILHGQVDPRSDQYSLALVYQEMLTGTFPYVARTPQQILIAHVTAQPDLSSLPEEDRGAVAKALSKDPKDRFESCLDFVRGLIAGIDGDGLLTGPLGKSRSNATKLFLQRSIEMTPGPSERTGRHSVPGGASGTVPFAKRTAHDDTPPNAPQSPLPPMVTPSGRILPPLVPAGRWPTPPPVSVTKSTPEDDHLPIAAPEPSRKVRINPIRTVIPAARLQGKKIPDALMSGPDFGSALASAAAAGSMRPLIPGDVVRLPDGTYICQFPTSVPESFAPLKVGVVREQWGMSMEQPEPGKIVFRKSASAGIWSKVSGKKGGLELIVNHPTGGKAIGEVTATANLFGTPDREFVQLSQTAIPRMLEAVRRELGTMVDRRKSPRLAVNYAMTVHPLHSDGIAEPARFAKCKDVSAGGVAFTVSELIKTRYAYVEFAGVPGLAGLAILMKLIRSAPPASSGGEFLYAGPFRLEL